MPDRNQTPARGGIEMHLMLSRQMAWRHGVDLSVALAEGLLTRADFAAMIDRCRVCPGTPGDCRDFQEDDRHGTCAPDWCANRTVLEGLRGLT